MISFSLKHNRTNIFFTVGNSRYLRESHTRAFSDGVRGIVHHNVEPMSSAQCVCLPALQTISCLAKLTKTIYFVWFINKKPFVHPNQPALL